MFTKQEFFNKVSQYNEIVILRHIHPDYDALGAQAGIAAILKNEFPDKNIKCFGYENSIDPSFIPNPESIENIDLKNALIILVDTSTDYRIDGKDIFDQAKEHIVFDHHHGNPWMNEKWANVQDSVSSCSEIIADFFKDEKPLDKTSATYLYAGMISDTIRFSTNTVNNKTLLTASYLLESNIDLKQINIQCFSYNDNEFKYITFLRNNGHFDDNIAWYILEKDVIEKFKMTPSEAKNHINAFSSLKGLKAWALFAKEDDDNYSCSLRSNTISILDIAKEYGGGGHLCAAGIPAKLKLEDCYSIIEKLRLLK